MDTRSAGPEAPSQQVSAGTDTITPQDAVLQALTQAAFWFYEYAEIHARKGDADKEQRNQRRGDFCRNTVLAATRLAAAPQQEP